MTNFPRGIAWVRGCWRLNPFNLRLPCRRCTAFTKKWMCFGRPILSLLRVNHSFICKCLGLAVVGASTSLCCLNDLIRDLPSAHDAFVSVPYDTITSGVNSMDARQPGFTNGLLHSLRVGKGSGLKNHLTPGKFVIQWPASVLEDFPDAARRATFVSRLVSSTRVEMWM
jgi:hypothetical protein